MAATLDFDLSPSGLWTDPSPLEEAPPGALTQAENCVIYRPGVLEPRRGMQTAITIGSTGTARRCKKLTPFDGAVFAAFFGSTDRFVSLADGGLQRLVNGWTGSAEQPEFTVNDVSGAVVRKSLYVTTDQGPVRLDSAADTTMDHAGTPIGVQGLAAALATGVLQLEDNNQYAYRIVFYRLINSAKAFSAPSGRFKVVLSAVGASRAATITIPLPADLTTSDYVQVYRSKKSGGATTEPNDEMFLAVESKVTGTGSMSLEDHTADIDLGAALYTNAGSEGLLQASYRPPKATKVAEFNGMLFLADTKGWHRLLLQLVNTTSTAAQGVAWDTFTGDIPVAGGTVITNVTPNPTGLAGGSVVGRYVSEVLTTGPVAPGTNFAAQSKIVSVTGTTITIDTATVGVAAPAATFHAHAWIEVPTGRRYYFGSATSVANRQAQATASDALATIRALAHVINMDTNAAAEVWANVGVASGTQAALQLEARRLTPNATGIRAYPGAAWSPKPADAADDVTLDDSQRVNRLMWSKLQQPEAVPVGHYIDIGSEKHAIRALARTREALFVFKADGVWRVTGRTPADLRVDPFDQTLVLLNTEAIVEHRNRIFCWTNQGIVAVDDTGVMPLSQPAIGKDLLDIERDLEAAPTTEGLFAAASESDDYVVFGLPANTSDGYCTKLYWLNTRLMRWTRWNFSETRSAGAEQQVATAGQWSAALVDPADGLLMLAGSNGADALAKKEVDSGLYTHSDVTTAATITAITGASPTQELEFSAGPEPNVGDAYVQGAIFGVVTQRVSATKALMRSTGAFITGAATHYRFITATIEWAAKTAPAPNVLKDWLGGCLSFERLSQVYDFAIHFSTPQVQTPESVTHTRLDGIVTSDFAEEVEFWPTRSHSIATRLIPKVVIARACARWLLSGLVLEAVPMTTTTARTR